MKEYKEPNNQESDIVSESWGGTWTETKLDAFEKYVRAYLMVMKNYRHENDWKLIYFDGFAGSGSRTNNHEDEESGLLDDLFSDNEITHEEINVYRGSAERVASIKDVESFDYFYFVEKDDESRDHLKSVLTKYDLKNPVFRVDANTEIKKLAQALRQNRKYKALVLLDPFGMQVDWDSIKMLKGLSVDLFILIPTGVIINRLLDRKGELTHLDKLKSFFGLSESEIKQIFYKKISEQSLFGEETRIEKIQKPIEKIAEVYLQRLRGLFKKVIPHPLVLKNSRNVAIYHFAFASQNSNALKIAGQIIDKEQS